jgi:hypothetical protein
VPLFRVPPPEGLHFLQQSDLLALAHHKPALPTPVGALASMELPGTVKRRELDGEGLWRWTPVSFGLREDGIVAAKDLKQWSVIVDARAWRAADAGDPGPCGFDVDTVGGGAESYIAESAAAAKQWVAAIKRRAAGEEALPEAEPEAPPPPPPQRRTVSEAEETPEDEPEDEEKRSASPPPAPSMTQLAEKDPEVVEDTLAVDTTDAVELARAETAEDRARRAVAAEAAARTQVAAVREDLAALALQRAGDVEARSQERLKASEAVAKQKTETQKWRERYEASEHSRLSQKGQLDELRRLQKQCARLEGRAEALEERVKIEATRRRKAEAACDAHEMRAVRLQQQLDIAQDEVELLRGAQSRQRRDRDRLLSTINRTDAIVYGGKARTPRPFFGSKDVPSTTRSRTRARSDQGRQPAWRSGVDSGPRSRRKHVSRGDGSSASGV